MAKTVAIDTNTAKKLVVELERFEEFKNHVLRLLPEEVIPYGSSLWWQKAEMEADEDIRAGKYSTYESVEELIKDLHAGK